MLVWNSFVLVGVIVVIGVFLVFFMGYGVCFLKMVFVNGLNCLVGFGYVVLGVVIVVGVLILVMCFDNWLVG